VEWGNLDFLIIDAPPGTSDEHITIAQSLKTNTGTDGAVIVTTPQEVSLLAVRKGINFCKKVKLPILGVVENMSGFVCPCCETKTEIYKASTGGATKMATEMKIPFLGSIPLDPELLNACDRGESYFSSEEILKKPSPAYAPFHKVIQNILASTPALKATALKAKPLPSVTVTNGVEKREHRMEDEESTSTSTSKRLKTETSASISDSSPTTEFWQPFST